MDDLNVKDALTDEEVEEFLKLQFLSESGKAEISGITVLTMVLLPPAFEALFESDSLREALNGIFLSLPFILCLFVRKGHNWARLTLGIMSALFAAVAFIYIFYEFLGSDEFIEYIFMLFGMVFFCTFPIIIAVMLLKNKTIKAYCKIKKHMKKTAQPK